MNVLIYPRQPLPAPLAEHVTEATGWAYFTEEDADEDRRKLSHWLTHQDTGETRRVRWTPYATMTMRDLYRLISMDFPEPPVGTNWNSEHLEMAWWKTFTPILQGMVKEGRA
jgi:hypothetical protein